MFLLSCFLYFFITAVTAQIFISVAELAVATGIPAKEAEAEIETHSVQCSYNFKKSYKPFRTSYLLIHFALFIQNIISCLIYI